MRSVEIRRAQFRMRLGVETHGAHEAERLGDPVGKLLVALGLGAVLDEAQHPAVRVLKVCVAAAGEGAQKVQRRRGLASDRHPIAGADQARAPRPVNSMSLTMSPR